jgi:hypothetical protein
MNDEMADCACTALLRADDMADAMAPVGATAVPLSVVTVPFSVITVLYSVAPLD